jgi:hypothetical protein
MWFPKKWSQSLPLWSRIVILQIIMVKWNTTDAAAIAKNKESWDCGCRPFIGSYSLFYPIFAQIEMQEKTEYLIEWMECVFHFISICCKQWNLLWFHYISPPYIKYFKNGKISMYTYLILKCILICHNIYPGRNQ